MIYRVSSAHEEGGERVYAVSTQEFLGDERGRVRALRLVAVEGPASGFAPVPGTERLLVADLVLLAMGFTGADPAGLLDDLGVAMDARGNVARDAAFATSVPGTERELRCDLVLLAMGFTGAERPGLLTDLGVRFDERGNVARDASYATSVPGVFAAGDMGRGQSLIVWAIAEGRSAAAGVDRYLTGTSALPAPIPPTARPLA